MTMFKLETMIYASEGGTNSVFTLNLALQKQLDALATQHPEVCQRKARGEAGGVSTVCRSLLRRGMIRMSGFTVQRKS